MEMWLYWVIGGTYYLISFSVSSLVMLSSQASYMLSIIMTYKGMCFQAVVNGGVIPKDGQKSGSAVYFITS